MTVIHQELASGRWQQMPLVEQMANIGSEVERAFHWKEKNNSARSMKSIERALELLLTSAQLISLVSLNLQCLKFCQFQNSEG